ncbi:MAG: hypothetical protein HQL15_09940 [Candidatus Omnitrophica bacterium]|nr:hypothetical protein [Candidatus Omnitrophota bacterium]
MIVGVSMLWAVIPFCMGFACGGMLWAIIMGGTVLYIGIKVHLRNLEFICIGMKIDELDWKLNHSLRRQNFN